MTISYFIRLECLIEKWQSRRKTIEIATSLRPRAHQDTATHFANVQNEELHRREDVPPQQQQQRDEVPKVSTTPSPDKEPQSSSLAGAACEAPLAYKLINNKRAATATSATTNGGGLSGGKEPESQKSKQLACQRFRKRTLRPPSRNFQGSLKPSALASYPGLLYVSLLLYNYCLLLQLLAPLYSAEAASVVGSPTPAASLLQTRSATSSLQSALSLGGQLYGSPANMLNLIHQLAGSTDRLQQRAHRVRWTRVPTPPSPGPSNTIAGSLFRGPLRPSPQHSSPSSNLERRGPISRALTRIRSRIGARNSIRVHNAFRDLLWRVLSNLSMPTPVIYELRRQHLYSSSEDLQNDSLHDKNTAQTIRSKRRLRPPLASRALERASADDEDDEPESLRERVRSRLEQLVKLSRRTLFGRVIRVPSLFPFKRQETDDVSPTALPVADNTPKGSNIATKTAAGVGKRRRLLGRRRRKETDRQKIFINGKQFYVDDEGELKEVNEKDAQID